jgi:hypothetical protein
MEVIKSKPATNEFRDNFDKMKWECPKCLGKGKITFGDDTESGREEVTCDCRKKS